MIRISESISQIAIGRRQQPLLLDKVNHFGQTARRERNCEPRSCGFIDELFRSRSKSGIAEQIPKRRVRIGNAGNPSKVLREILEHLPPVLVDLFSRRSGAVLGPHAVSGLKRLLE